MTAIGENVIPPPSKQTKRGQSKVRPRARVWVRATLLFFAVGLIAVFAAAIWIDPYGDDRAAPEDRGSYPAGDAALRVLCGFRQTVSRLGLTTSFSLLMHGDVVNSLRANAVGTLLALFCLAMIPWSVWITIRGRYLWVTSIERASLWVGGAFLLLLLIRWGIVLL